MRHFFSDKKRFYRHIHQHLKSISQIVFCFAFSVFCLTGISTALSAQLAVPSIRIDTQNPSAPWHISADQLYYDQVEDQYFAEGNVKATKKDTQLMADFIRIDHKRMKALAIGNVILTDGSDVLTGNRIMLNLLDDTGTVYDGALFFRKSNFYIRGNKIQKVGKNTYTAKKASISTCAGEDPTWKITGSDIKVTLDGYAFAKHAAFWTRAGPVLYVPFISFPVKLERQSGFLSPLFGYSDRKGYEYQQPYFWAINDHSDATFFGQHMEYRGERLGLEYQYLLSEISRGTMMFDFLDDRQVDDGTEDSSDRWGYPDDTFLRPNSDRYWFRMKHDQSLPYGIFAKIDFDIVSDQDYLHEFKSGFNGYDESNRYFERVFGRGLDDSDDTIRTNSLILNRTWEKSSFNIVGQWYDNVIFRRQGEPDDPDTTLQRIPSAEYDISKQSILTSPFYFDLASEYVRFYRKDGLRGYRADVYPRLYLPVAFKNYFTFEPSLGIRETFWYTDQFDDKTKEQDSTQLRDLYDAGFTLSTEIDRLFSIKGKRIDKIKHSIVPRVAYEYRPEKKQDQYPSYDGVDRIGKGNTFSYSLINTFISRSKIKPDQTDGAEYQYQEFARFELGQSYDINEATDKDKEKKKPFSDIVGRLDLNPSTYFSLDFQTRYSVYKNDFTDFNTQLELSDIRGDKLFVEHRYRPDSSEETEDGKESIYAKLLINITNQIAASGEYERNIYDRQDIKTGLGLLYKAQCWSVELRYNEEANDRAFLVNINLYGLGGFGSSLGGSQSEE
jgi:LPS-assembly protein